MNPKPRVFAAIIIACALAVVLALTCLRKEDRRRDVVKRIPQHRYVRVSGLPISADFRCGQLTLNQMRRRPSEAHVVLSLSRIDRAHLPPGTYLALGDTEFVCDTGAKGRETDPLADADGTTSEVSFYGLSRAKTVTITQDVFIRRPSSVAVFKFRNLVPNSPPRTRRVGNAAVTVCSAGMDVAAYVTNMVSEDVSPGAMQDGEPCFLIHTSALLPEGFVREEDSEGASSYVITDDRGRTRECLRHSTDNGLKIRSDPFDTSEPISAGTGRLVTVNDYFVFRPMNPLPNAITFEIKGRFPPDPKDIIKVTFHDVPLR